MDNYKKPRNSGRLDSFTVNNKSTNKSCGDVIEVFLQIENNKIKDIKYEAQGCAMSVAAMSIFSTKIKRKDLDEILKITDEDFFDIINIHPTLSRIKCVLLGLGTIKEAINKLKSESDKNAK